MEAHVMGLGVAMWVKRSTSIIVPRLCMLSAWQRVPYGLTGAVSIFTSCGEILLFHVDVNGRMRLLCVVVGGG